MENNTNNQGGYNSGSSNTYDPNSANSQYRDNNSQAQPAQPAQPAVSSHSANEFEPIDASKWSWGSFMFPWMTIIAARKYVMLLLFLIYFVPAFAAPVAFLSESLMGVVLIMILPFLLHLYFGFKGRKVLQDHKQGFANNSELAGFIRGFDRTGKVFFFGYLAALLIGILVSGVLGGVVLTSLNNAREGGSQAAAKANLSNMRASAELHYDINGSYVGICKPFFEDGIVDYSLEELDGFTCDDSQTEWRAYADLGGDQVYCVDSTGVASEISADGVGMYSCSAPIPSVPGWGDN